MRRVVTVLSSLALSCAVLVGGATSGATSTTTTSVAGAGRAQNLVVSAAVRLSIFDALAKFHQLPTKDYVRLTPKMTYYAYDAANHTYYAAAGIEPSPHSLQAQVGAQDDGGYQLLTHQRGVARWKVYDDGLGGADGSRCPITIPPSVLAVWNWRPGSCFPPL